MAGIPENVEGSAAKRLARATPSGGPVRAISALLAGGIAGKKKKAPETGGRDSAIDYYNRDLYQARRESAARDLTLDKQKHERAMQRMKHSHGVEAGQARASQHLDLMAQLKEYGDIAELGHGETRVKFTPKKNATLPEPTTTDHAEGRQMAGARGKKGTPSFKDVRAGVASGNISQAEAVELGNPTYNANLAAKAASDVPKAPKAK